MDNSCDNLLTSLPHPKPCHIKNMFKAQFLHKFSGPMPGKLFIDQGNKGCHAFTLHVDFFNPEGMNLCGASMSSGVISMECLNLPANLHYKLENLYLAGIIPGPKQPSVENLNHYICPLMQDLALSWVRGVRYSRTANHMDGHTTCSAVVLIICDLPAAWHLAALAGVTSHFYCSACNCYHKTTYDHIDFSNWTPHDKDKLRHYAEQWRDAPTSAEREQLFKSMEYVTLSSGICCTGIHLINSLLMLCIVFLKA